MSSTPAQHTYTVADCREAVRVGRLGLLPDDQQELAQTAHPQFLFALYPQLADWRYIGQRLMVKLSFEIQVEDYSYFITERWRNKSMVRGAEYDAERHVNTFDDVLQRYHRRVPGDQSTAHATMVTMRQHANDVERRVFGNGVDPAHYDMLVLIDNIYVGLGFLCMPVITTDDYFEHGLATMGDLFYTVLTERINLVGWVMSQFPDIKRALNSQTTEVAS